jgi:hypothetical protein
MLLRGVVGRRRIEERGVAKRKKKKLLLLLWNGLPQTLCDGPLRIIKTIKIRGSNFLKKSFCFFCFFVFFFFWGGEKEKRVQHTPQLLDWKKIQSKKANLYFLEKVMRYASKPIASKEKTSEVTRFNYISLPLSSFRKHLKTLL